MELLEEAVPNASELALAKALIEEVGKRTGLSHNVDLGLVTLRRALGLEKGAACCCSVSAEPSAGSPTPLNNIKPDA